MSNDELSCRELVEIVSDYLEGALAAPDRARFEQHLSECEGCTAYLDQMRRTLAVMGRLTEDSIPPGARDRLLQAFRSWAAARS